MATTWRGQDGSVSLGGTPKVAVGGVYGWTVVSEFGALECSVMGEVWRTYRPGMPGWNGTMRARFNNDDGQDQLVETVTGANPAGALAEVRFEINDQNDPSPGARYLAGEVIITGVNINAELTNIIEATYNFQGSGPLTLTWTP